MKGGGNLKTGTTKITIEEGPRTTDPLGGTPSNVVHQSNGNYYKAAESTGAGAAEGVGMEGEEDTVLGKTGTES